MSDDDDDFDEEQWDRLRDVQDRHGLMSVFSVVGVTADDLDKVPFPGASRVIHDSYPEVGEAVLPPNATWLDLWRAADALIRQAAEEHGDRHHIWIESFKPSEEDPRTLLMWAGS